MNWHPTFEFTSATPIAVTGGDDVSRRNAVAGILALVLVTSCGGEPADRVNQAETPAPAAPPRVETLRTIISAGALANRHEAQGSFDRARRAIVREDYARASRELAAAAAFMQKHAEEAELGAKAALQGASKELEVLAHRLARDEAQTTRTLDRVFANANRAEGQHHLTRSEAAIEMREYPRAGEELTMAVDHLERAAHDLRGRHNATAEAALMHARVLAEQMMRGAVPTRGTVRNVTHELEAELRRLCAIIDAEAVACAIIEERR